MLSFFHYHNEWAQRHVMATPDGIIHSSRNNLILKRRFEVRPNPSSQIRLVTVSSKHNPISSSSDVGPGKIWTLMLCASSIQTTWPVGIDFKISVGKVHFYNQCRQFFNQKTTKMLPEFFFKQTVCLWTQNIDSLLISPHVKQNFGAGFCARN